MLAAVTLSCHACVVSPGRVDVCPYAAPGRLLVLAAVETIILFIVCSNQPQPVLRSTEHESRIGKDVDPLFARGLLIHRRVVVRTPV